MPLDWLVSVETGEELVNTHHSAREYCVQASIICCLEYMLANAVAYLQSKWGEKEKEGKREREIERERETETKRQSTYS